MPVSSLSLFFHFFQNYRNAGYLLNITLILDRYLCSLAELASVKYDCDSEDLFYKINIFPNGEITEQNFRSPFIWTSFCHDDVIKWKHFPCYWPLCGEFPAQRPVTQSFEVFFDLRRIKRLNKQSWGWRFEMLSRPLWRHSNCNAYHWITAFKLHHSYSPCFNGQLIINRSELAKNPATGPKMKELNLCCDEALTTLLFHSVNAYMAMNL